jgi:lipopolysaccharide transport system permease protein
MSLESDASSSHPVDDLKSPEFRWYSSQPTFSYADVWELWDARELIETFAIRDLKLRYRQTVIGFLWAILQPLVPLIIFAVVTYRLLPPEVRSPVEPVAPYPLISLCGLMLWFMFANGLTNSSMSLVNSRHLVTKVYFPRLVLPISALFSCVVDFACACSLLILLAVWYAVPPTPAILAAPLFVLLMLVITFAYGVWLSSLNAKYRDFGFLVPFVLQMGFFLSPVVYKTDRLPPRWQQIYSLNPLVGAIEGFRWSVTGMGPFPWFAVISAILTTSVVLVTGLMHFRQVDRLLADRI